MEDKENHKSKFRVRFVEEGQNMVARIALPTPTGTTVVKAEVPMVGMREEVKRFISAHTDVIGSDLSVLEGVNDITRRAAKRRLIRKLHDNVGFWPGGPKTSAMDTSAKDLLADARGNQPVRKKTAIRQIFIIAKEAHNGVPAGAIALAALRRNNTPQTNKQSGEFIMPVDIGDEMVGGIKSFVKKIAKKTAKVAVKTDSIVTDNPLAKTLISTVPGGAAALSARDYAKNAAKVVTAAKNGNPKAKAAIAEVNKSAKAGDKNAQNALKGMANVNDSMKGKPSKSTMYRRAVRMGVDPGIWA